MGIQRKTFRNPVAQNPLLRKGGPHQKSRSAERRDQGHDLHSGLDEWYEEQEWLERGSVSDDTDSSLMANAA